MIFGCKHNWELLKTEKFEASINDYVNLRKGNFYLKDNETEMLLRRGIVSIYKCKKCGRIKHIKTIF